MRTRAAILLALTAIGVACGSDPPDSTDVIVGPGSSAVMATAPEVVVETEFVEQAGTVQIPIQRPQGIEPLGPVERWEFEAVAWTPDGYVAVGDFGGVAMWSSVDGVNWELLAEDICCEAMRGPRPGSLLWADGVLWLTVRGQAPGRAEVDLTALLRSEDGGIMWQEVDAEPWRVPGNRVDNLQETGDVLTVNVVDDADPQNVGRAPTGEIWRSVASGAWELVVIPDARPDAWPYVVTGEDSAWVVIGQNACCALWRTDDFFDTFVAEPLPPSEWIDSAFVVDGHLAVEETDDTGAGRPFNLLDGEWVAAESVGDEWTDPDTRLLQIETAGDAAYAFASRGLRSSPHYCYLDALTCDKSVAAVMASSDGLRWGDVLSPDVVRRSSLVGGDDGSVLLLQKQGEVDDAGVAAVSSWRWPGIGPAPSTTYFAPAPAPEPVPFLDWRDGLAVGEEARVSVDFRCSLIYLDEEPWVAVEERPFGDAADVPLEWPVKPQSEFVMDGPGDLLFGRIERTAEDRLTFSVEGVGPIVEYRPRVDGDPECIGLG